LFIIQDQRGNQLYLGINHTGILTFQGSKKMNHFSWSQVQKINFEGKMFIIHIILNEVFFIFNNLAYSIHFVFIIQFCILVYLFYLSICCM